MLRKRIIPCLTIDENMTVLKPLNLKKKDIELLKSLDDNTLKKYLEDLKRKNNLPLIVQLMERVKKL